MTSEVRSPVRCPNCPGRSQILESLGGEVKRRRRQCQVCGSDWRTVEVTHESYQEMESRIQELEDDLRQASYDAAREKKLRMADIRTAVTALAKYAELDPTIRLYIEHLKTRGEFLHTYSRELHEVSA